jgi:hypothetical protein
MSDFVNSWNQAELERLVAHCLNTLATAAAAGISGAATPRSAGYRRMTRRTTSRIRVKSPIPIYTAPLLSSHGNT